MDNPVPVPHVFIFPLPIQSPVTSMLKLAELLCLHGVQVTFLNTKHNHQRLLLRSTDVESRFRRYPGFRFEVISDGLPENHPRSAEHLEDVVKSLETVAEPLLREMLMKRSVTCGIVEGMFHYAFEIGIELGVPVFAFETISPCCLWVYLCIPKLFLAQQLPIQGEDLDRLVDGVQGMEGLLRVRDLPHIFRVQNPWEEKNSELVKAEIHSVPKAHGLILNSFEELDAAIIPHIRSQCPKTYMIGPVQQHLNTRLAEQESTVPPSSSSFWEEDKTCIQWLDGQPAESVIYVSFGSLATLTRAQILEFWHGLVSSRVTFLWVVRPNIVKEEEEEDQFDQNCLATQNGYIVSWAPQEEVLLHPAIGGFLTHSGWNSTLESIIAGKPMICWALGVDQMVTSRLVSEVWKIGLDIKDKCDRVTVEKAVKEVMVGSRREELKKSSEKLSRLARESVNGGGSSHASLDSLINDIRRLSCSNHFNNIIGSYS